MPRMVDFLNESRRRGTRRRVRTRCRAVHWGRFELVGERLLDLSPNGALLACDAGVRAGDEVLLTFRMPWLGPDVLVLAEVARVLEGYRYGDPGYCAGLRFLDLDPSDRVELCRRLAMLEEPEAQRAHPVDYARTVSLIEHEPDALSVFADA